MSLLSTRLREERRWGGPRAKLTIRVDTRQFSRAVEDLRGALRDLPDRTGRGA